MKKYINISGLILRDTNRGTAALGYGAISFLKEKGFLKKGQELLQYKIVKKTWKYKDYSELLEFQGNNVVRHIVHVSIFELWLFMNTGIILPWTRFGKTIRDLEYVAAINGGDGFSDIYNTETFRKRLLDTLIAMKARIPIVILPQTIGPFSEKRNYLLARRILTYARNVYVRDDRFVQELNKMGVKYELEKDLSSFMKPEPWNIDIQSGSIGINVSGLCYSNTFRSLTGQFNEYPNLIDSLIKHFQRKGNTIYLIPHSYHFGKYEESNDDIEACTLAYNRLKNKKNVILIDKDLISPQIKYVISKMSFFIGTRMHANFAAIYTGVPVFGLAYSYKFAGAFSANGLDSDRQTTMINNISHTDISNIIDKIDSLYNQVISKCHE